MAAVYWFICAREAYPAALPIVAGSQANFNRATVNAVGNLRKSRHGIGDLLARPNSKSVNDHLLCDGSAIDRISYPQLFAELGTDWGAGDGVNTFNLPNLNVAALPVPVSTPPQDVGDGGTVNTGETPDPPTNPGETGGGGGNVTTGGRPRNRDPGDIPMPTQ
jgi:hypothetical protein